MPLLLQTSGIRDKNNLLPDQWGGRMSQVRLVRLGYITLHWILFCLMVLAAAVAERMDHVQAASVGQDRTGWTWQPRHVTFRLFWGLVWFSSCVVRIKIVSFLASFDVPWLWYFFWQNIADIHGMRWEGGRSHTSRKHDLRHERNVHHL